MRAGKLLPRRSNFMEEPSLVKLLREKKRLKPEDKIWIKTLPRRESLYADNAQITQNLELTSRLEKLNIRRPYIYQREAISAIRSGEDVVISTPTASGKSLCYNVPIIEALQADSTARAIYAFPMKALANDQFTTLNQLRMSENGSKTIEAWIYDGDTDQEHRKLLRMFPPQIIITNPDMIHASFLAHHQQWSKLYQSIKFLVIDEIHEYRGFFGTNVAYIIRRFLHKCAENGTRPQLILCSATAANPEEHAYKLTNRKCRVIQDDSFGSPLKHFVFINPHITGFPHQEYLSRRFTETAVSIAGVEMSILCFCPTRKSAERLTKHARREAVKQSINPELIYPYRAGYKAEDRRKIEQGLKEGAIRLVFSTNALELGIDIGKLDVCFMLGFPETVMSTWQRAGRVGRSIDKEAYVFIWANRHPIDQFYIGNPRLFFEKPLDNLVIDLTNEEVVKNHYECIISENEETKEINYKIIGDEVRVAVDGDVELIDVNGHFLKRYKPHYSMDIRSISQGTYKLVIKGSNAELGSISGDKIFSEAYLGAVYDHMGRSYRVVAHGSDEIMLNPCSDEVYTKPARYTHINITEVIDGKRWKIKGGYAELLFGKLSIREALAGYVEYDTHTKKPIKREKYDQERSKTYRTKGVWLSFVSDYSIIPNDFPPEISYEALHALGHGIRQAIPLIVTSDPFDITGIASANHQQAKLSMFIFDAIWGGIGVSQKSFELFPALLKQSLEITESCSCKSGCPGCIMISRCIKNNEELDKQNSIFLHRTLINLMKKEPYVLKKGSWLKI